MQAKEEKILKENKKSIPRVEKLNCKDIEDILKELQKKSTTS